MEKKKVIKILILIVAMTCILITLTGCGSENQEKNEVQKLMTNTDINMEESNTENKKEFTVQEATEIVRELRDKISKTGAIQKIDVDFVTEDINNESYLNFYNYEINIEENSYSLVVNKYTGEIYIFSSDMKTVSKITENNYKDYIKVSGNESITESIQVGEHYLTYGEYIGSFPRAEIKLNKDKTCQYNFDRVGETAYDKGETKNTTGTYQVIKIDDYGVMVDGIELNLADGTKEKYIVNANNSFENQWISFGRKK